MREKQVHLEMIQAVINRMATNSFNLKRWSVTLVAALFALAARDSALIFVYLAYFPAFAFWLLDGFFLHQEKLFRALYDHVRQLPEERIDFTMNTSVVRQRVRTWSDVVFTRTLLLFHGVVVATILIVMFLMSRLTRVG